MRQLVAVLLMENKRRGLFFGRRAPIPADVVDFVRRYRFNSGPDGAWPMFLFGFVGIFLITQAHGVG